MHLPTAIFASTALAVLALITGALTLRGTALAWVFCVVVSCSGGLPAFAVLAAVFLITAAASKFAGKRADPYNVRRKNGARDIDRVFCNVGIAAFAAGLYWITVYQGFMFAYAAVMAESLADSVASKIGPLTDGRTVDICTFRPAQAGISGGVSLAGTIAALMGSAAIGLLWLVSSRCSGAEAVLAAIVGFVGCMFDSVLGSCAQVRYRCNCCGKVTERDEHCGTACLKEKGIAWMNNDAVNLLSNIFAFILALAVYGVIN